MRLNFLSVTDWGTGKGADSAKTFAKMAALEDRVAESLGAGFDKSIAKDIVASTSTSGEIGLKTPKGISIGFAAGYNTNDASTAHKAKKLEAAFNLASQGMANISADERKSALENFKYSQAYKEGENNNNVSAKNFSANRTNANTFTESSEQARTKAQSLNLSASTIQDNWTTMSASLSTYAADVINKDGGMSTFNSLLQTNPDAAAKMYAKAISGITPGLAPTRPTTNLKEFSDTTPIAAKLEGGTGPVPRDTTPATFSAGKATVRGAGWNDQTPIGSSLKPIVNTAIQDADDVFIATRNKITSDTAEKRNNVTPLVQQKSMNLTPNRDGTNPTVEETQEKARNRLTK